MTTTHPDLEKVEEFAGRMVGLMNASMLSLMTSVGHRTGLFDTMATLPPSTSAQVAAAAGLDERYVREWLNAMTVGAFVVYDPASRTYVLPPEHAASLTRAAGPGNMASMAQFTALMGGVEDEIVGCFRAGGGVPYSRFPKFQELMAEMSGQVHDVALIEGELGLVDGLLDRLREGIDVCDVGCGQGHAINLMAKEFPNSRFHGLDFSVDGVAAAQQEAAALGLANATFEVKDAATLDGTMQFDLITVFDAVHDQARPDVVLKGIADSLRPGGVFLCVDIAGSSNVEDNLEHPLAAMLYSVSTFHCMTVSLALDGAGLGTMWGEQKAREMFREAGFTSVETMKVPEDILNVHYICRKD
ncbi:MAG: class SAM-dependent methyltransferase [Ilumatobacteraceae bacterium]|nr:class SAM-dependent methyltransferase [Ilumatobacteraceae bacterium]